MPSQRCAAVVVLEGDGRQQSRRILRGPSPRRPKETGHGTGGCMGLRVRFEGAPPSFTTVIEPVGWRTAPRRCTLHRTSVGSLNLRKPGTTGCRPFGYREGSYSSRDQTASHSPILIAWEILVCDGWSLWRGQHVNAAVFLSCIPRKGRGAPPVVLGWDGSARLRYLGGDENGICR